ncbi:MAG: pyridoxal 5'-phosphate synthase glutaminase subunit PdxT [Actinomycetota bacterium]|nr:pyridoxal 5'-phosphate synthase glutaminase subunit PdxT [Actinomycetota bacterium]
MKVGVLSLQGAFREHIEKIKKCGAGAVEIKFPGQLRSIDGLIIPGGESTTIKKLLKQYNFRKALDKFYNEGRPIFGTCAGLVLVSENIEGEDKGMGYINIDVKRNAYGRQIDSFEEVVSINFSRTGQDKNFRAIFIRAPKILRTGSNVKVIAEINGEPVLVRYKNVMAGTFHPELSDDLRVHEYFLNMIKNYKGVD